MKAIFLAAGEGKRLRPLTEKQPKSMVLFRKKPIIQYGIEAMRHNDITNISIVRGYLKEVVDFPGVKYYENTKFEKTNMVATFFCSAAEFDDDLLISYADIIYQPEIVQKLAQSTADISVVIDIDWHKLWSIRMEDPLEDAETLKLDEHGHILELGKKAASYDEIQGQYMGLIKLSKNILPSIQEFYNQLDRDNKYDGQSFDNLFMTSFLQLLIDGGYSIKAVPVHGGWLEIDSIEDLLAYEQSDLFQ